MRSATHLTLAAVICLLLQAACAKDRSELGITKSENEGRFNVCYDNATLQEILADVVREGGYNIVASKDALKNRITVNLTDVELLPALSSIVECHGLILGERVTGSGVYTVRPRTFEDERAAAIKRFFDALRREGFSEEQAMQILLRSMDK